MIKKFAIFEEIGLGDYPFDMDNFNIENFFNPKPTEKEEFKRKVKEVAKSGKLYNQLASGRRLTFGVLKAIHQDAIQFKERREYLSGLYKFFHRAIPIALAPVYFPIWMVQQFLGATRALNKVFVPVMLVKKVNYQNFMSGLIEKVMDITEGDIHHFYDDWFYRSFAVEKGLINMAKKEAVIDFSYKLAEKMSKEPDYKPVPQYYVENEFRKYLNKEFHLDPPLTLKVKKKKSNTNTSSTNENFDMERIIDQQL